MEEKPYLSSSEGLYRELLDRLDVGVYFVDRARRITFWNRGAEAITGFTKEDILGKYCYHNILNHIDNAGCKMCLSACPLAQTINYGKERNIDVFLHHKEGYRVKVHNKAFPIYEDGKIIGAVEVFRKVYVSDLQKDKDELDDINYTETELKVLSLYDMLTGLPNRRYLDFTLKSKIDEYHALGIAFGVLFIDIDDFRGFNNTYGHDLGDRILKVVSTTFTTSLKGRDFLGRYGGEEFVGVFTLRTKEELASIAEKIRFLVENSIIRKQGGSEYNVTISIGGTLVREGDDVNSLLARADENMYVSKHSGKNRVTVL